MPNVQKDLGPVSAYAIAVKHGYTGTEEEWAALQIAAAENAAAAAQSAQEAANTLAAVEEYVAQETAKAVQEITTQETASIALVEEAASASGAAQEEAIAAKGAETLASIPEDYTELSGEVSQLSAEISDLESKTGLKYTNGEKLTPLYNYMESFVADGVTQNADGKVYRVDGTLATSSGSTSYRATVAAGDVYLISGRLSSYYIVLFAGDVVHRAYSITDVGAEITESGHGTYEAAAKSFKNWRLVIPDGVDAIGVTVATYSGYNGTLYKEENVVEYINVTDVKAKADAAHEHTVMPVSTMPTYLKNVLGYKPLGALSKPYICLSTDDGREGLIHQTIEMVVDVAHVPVTFCIHSKADIFYAQKRKKYTLAQVAEKINGAIVNEDCELALHDNRLWADKNASYTTPYTEATLYQFVQDEKAFIANPFERDTNTELAVSWAYKSASAPEHATDAVVSVVMGGEFGVLRSGDTALGTIKNIYDYKCLGARSNLYCLTSKNFNSSMYNSLEKAKAAVDYAIENNLLLPIFWHEAIMASATEESNEGEHITDEQITNILLPMIEYAKTKGVEFVTLSQIPYLK